MQNKSKTSIQNHPALLSDILKKHLDGFKSELLDKGYTKFTVDGYYGSAIHFCTWIRKKQIFLKKINNDLIIDFARHRCDCYGAIRKNKLSCHYLNRVQRFIYYLHQKKLICSKINPATVKIPPLFLKFQETLNTSGLASATIEKHKFYVSKLLPLLGNNPKKYSAGMIRKVIYKAAKQSSLPTVKKLVTALKAYLRFLIVEGVCCSNLDAAVPTVGQWKLSSLPKYIPENKVELIIASCNIHTKSGLRDRAILLLLARLGLRAGDIVNMLIDDINWLEGTLVVSGKGRREIRLPLPQEVGDALLAYLENARPKVTIKKFFLCLNAPYRPFRFSNNISDIVRVGLSRAGITDPLSRGANLLRHSLATKMLRNGAALENISAVLRHRSLDMTAYYAKVDVRMLLEIAQPWPEVFYAK